MWQMTALLLGAVVATIDSILFGQLSIPSSIDSTDVNHYANASISHYDCLSIISSSSSSKGSISSNSFLSCPSIWPCFFSASQTTQWRVASKVSSKTKRKQVTPPCWIVQLGLQEFAKTIDESEKCHHRVLYIQCHLVIEVLCQDLCNDQGRG